MCVCVFVVFDREDGWKAVLCVFGEKGAGRGKAGKKYI